MRLPKRRGLRVVDGPVPVRQSHVRVFLVVDRLQGGLELEKKLAMPGQETGPVVGGNWSVRSVPEVVAVLFDEIVLNATVLESLCGVNERLLVKGPLSVKFLRIRMASPYRTLQGLVNPAER